MRKLFVITFSLLATLSVCSAEEASSKGSSALAVFGGLGFTSTELDLGAQGGEEPIAEGGGTFGAQWIYYFQDRPLLGLGIDASGTELSESETTDLVVGSNATSDLDSSSIMLIMKLAYPAGRARPYVFGGIGMHRTEVFLSAKPYGPYSWADTSTDERRVLIDETKTGLAIGMGVGIDFFLTERLFLGGEYRATFLTASEFKETPGAQAVGLNFEKNSLNVLGLLFRLGVKF